MARIIYTVRDLLIFAAVCAPLFIAIHRAHGY